MKITLDTMESAVGWVSGAGGTVGALNTYRDYIAGNKSASLFFQFSAPGAWVEKTLATPIDISEAKQIALSLWSRNQRNDVPVSHQDFSYQIEFGGSEKYLLKTGSTFDACVFQVAIASVSKIRITMIRGVPDYLLVSDIVACDDELPLDIFVGMQEQIKLERDAVIGADGILLGSVDIDQAGNVTVMDAPFVQKWAVVLFKKGADSETHQVADYDGQSFTFTNLYDGETVKKTMAGATAYLVIPVEYGEHEKEAILPGIVIWNLAPEIIRRTGKLDTITDTFRADSMTMMQRKEGETQNFFVNIDLASRSAELTALMSRIVRRVITKQVIWFNGRKMKIDYMGTVNEELRSQSYSDIMKLTYQVAVEVREDVYDREVVFPVLSTNTSVNIKGV